jgi:hypothetical protein
VELTMLKLDEDGALWLRRDEEDGGVTLVLLGPIAWNSTGYDVPPALMADYGRLLDDWNDGVAFSRAIRAEQLTHH